MSGSQYYIQLNPDGSVTHVVSNVLRDMPVQRIRQLCRNDIARGLELGYPRCCIAAFVRVVHRRGYPAYEFWQRHPQEHGKSHDYVPCEACYTRNQEAGRAQY